MPAGIPGIWFAMQCKGIQTGAVIVGCESGGNQQDQKKMPAVKCQNRGHRIAKYRGQVNDSGRTNCKRCCDCRNEL